MALACEAHALSLDKRIKNSDGVSVSSYESIMLMRTRMAQSVSAIVLATV